MERTIYTAATYDKTRKWGYTMRILFCKVDWMENYAGYEGDGLQGVGESEEEKVHGEAYNFAETEDGRMQGFVNIEEINLEKLGGRQEDEKVDDVMVVWLSKHPVEGGIRITGWYKEAVVYKDNQPPQPDTPRLLGDHPYNIECDANKAILLPEEDRVFQIRATNEIGKYVYAKAWYAEDEKNSIIVENVITYISDYEADLLEAQLKGLHTFTDEEQSYIGQWKDNQENGYGISTFKEGDRYIGRYIDGAYHGEGIYKFKDRSRYIGEFKDGNFHGYGIYKFDNGNRYVGEFKEDKFHGYGIMYYSDGDIKKGIWEEDELIEEDDC